MSAKAARSPGLPPALLHLITFLDILKSISPFVMGKLISMNCNGNHPLPHWVEAHMLNFDELDRKKTEWLSSCVTTPKDNTDAEKRFKEKMQFIEENTLTKKVTKSSPSMSHGAQLDNEQACLMAALSKPQAANKRQGASNNTQDSNHCNDNLGFDVFQTALAAL